MPSATPLATLQDLEDIWQPIADQAEQDRANRLLAKASALLRQQMPHIDARIEAGTLDPTVAAVVVAQIVKRYLQNPSGASSVSTGPFSASYIDRYEGTDGSATIRGGLQVTKSDLAALKPVTKTTRIGTIRVAAGLAPQILDGGIGVEPDTMTNLDAGSIPMVETSIDPPLEVDE